MKKNFMKKLIAFAVLAMMILNVSAAAECQHQWTGGAVEVAPTCTEDGYSVVYCGKCGEEKREILPATGHQWNGGAQWIAPTCTEDGYSVVYCGECGEEKREVLPATGHKWSSDAVKVAPTCTKAGRTMLFCENCGAEKVKKIPATGHKWKRVVKKKATRKKKGKAVDTCKKCGECRTVSLPKKKGHKKHKR